MRKYLIMFMFFVAININSNAQSGYVEGNYYASAGTSQIICGPTYYDMYYNVWQDCQRQVWKEEYYTGFVYVWTGYNWSYQTRSGYFWTFYWYNYSTRIR